MEEKGKLTQWSKHFHHLVKRSPGEFRNIYLVPLCVPGTKETGLLVGVRTKWR